MPAPHSVELASSISYILIWKIVSAGDCSPFLHAIHINEQLAERCNVQNIKNPNSLVYCEWKYLWHVMLSFEHIYRF